MTSHTTRILVVDDNPLDRQLLEEHLTARGYDVGFARDGLEGWEMLESDPLRYDVVLLDRAMPRLDGMQVLARVKQHPRLRTLPVIMQTASAMRSEILEGIRGGAYYYLTKPYDSEVLIGVVETAARDFAEYRRLQQQVARGLSSLRLLIRAAFHLRTVDEARDLAAVLANVCPDPLNAVIGLTELLVNAVEHGNLGITYEEKTQLNATGSWDAEVRRRLALPENAGKFVGVQVERDDHEVRFVIRDQGHGFDWKRYIEIDPQRAFDNHGRGIAIARTLSFDAIEYRDLGNEVIARARLDSRPAAVEVSP